LVSFDTGNGIETYHTERQSTASAFPTPQLESGFGNTIAATGVTDDGCEVFGYDWASSSGEPTVYRSRRGE
jgi:hypothetical protein